jgi:hypothetical protein
LTLRLQQPLMRLVHPCIGPWTFLSCFSLRRVFGYSADCWFSYFGLQFDNKVCRQNLKHRSFDYQVGQQVLILNSAIHPAKSGLYVYTNGTATIQKSEHVTERINVRHLPVHQQCEICKLQVKKGAQHLPTEFDGSVQQLHVKLHKRPNHLSSGTSPIKIPKSARFFYFVRLRRFLKVHLIQGQ